MPIVSWATTSMSVEAVDASPQAALRTRIAWLCRLTRAVAVGWAAWLLIAMVWAWSDPAKIVSIVGHYLNADLGAISPAQFAWAFAVSIVAWIADAAVALCICRLFGAYLGGRIFTADAATWLQRVGIVGLIAILVDIVARRIDWLILTSHAELALSTRLFTQFFVPADLLKVLFCLFVLAIGRVFRTAVQIADDNASIV